MSPQKMMQIRLFSLFSLLVFLGVLLYLFCKSPYFPVENRSSGEKGNLGLDRGISPLYITHIFGGDHKISNLPDSIHPENCGTCHKEIWDDWSSSRHKQAFTNPLYRESHKREPLQWCTNCHAPILNRNGDPDKPEDRYLSDQGVSCAVCHLREGKILTSHNPAQPKVHTYQIEKSLRSSEFCSNCHQFSFPVGTGNLPHRQLRFSDQPMQNTYQEWQESEFNGRESCQDCHMKREGGIRSHKFPGGHNREFLNSSLDLHFQKEEDRYTVSLVGKRIGHAFPTGDLFRRLVIRFFDKRNLELHREEFFWDYGPNPDYPKAKDQSAKRLIRKRILFPPIQNGQSFLIWDLPREKINILAIRTYELSIQYISDQNRLGTGLKAEEIRMLIRKSPVVWEDREPVIVPGG